MPAEFKDGTINSYDSNTQLGNYRENNTTTDRGFETVKPVPPDVDVSPGQSVKVLFKTPSGREVNIAIEINGRTL